MPSHQHHTQHIPHISTPQTTSLSLLDVLLHILISFVRSLVRFYHQTCTSAGELVQDFREITLTQGKCADLDAAQPAKSFQGRLIAAGTKYQVQLFQGPDCTLENLISMPITNDEDPVCASNSEIKAVQGGKSAKLVQTT